MTKSNGNFGDNCYLTKFQHVDMANHSSPESFDFHFDDSYYALWEFPYAFFLWEILYGL